MGDVFTPEGGEIFEEPFDEALSKRYLAYALSTITQRALPDARDGLKPVHRRILHAMRVLKLNPRDAFKKSARVVGDVIGKFHPHGDQAVYDALVRLAQDFASRYPLVEGQGNFGNIDGDGAAAMRYTETRLTEAAELMLQDIDQGTVDFRETYDGSEEEPVVLPAAFPNLLANGATGIAVGMATSIPPHNAYELCRASRTLIAHPDTSVAQLLRSVKGPDFPTGGICVESTEAIRETYETGRGGFRLRAKWEIEDLGRGTWQIVVTEIPYQVQKSKLVERIAQLLDQKKLPLLEDVRDESAEDIRLVLVPKSKNVEAELLMAALFKMSELENRISLNLNVLDPSGTPRVMSLKDVLRIWLDHRREVVVRRANTRLAKVEDRLEVLSGYIIVYADLDEVIRIIRFEDEPKAKLMAHFDLSDRQAEAILNMRLRALRKLEELEIRKEESSLKDERGDLKTLIGSVAVQWEKVDGEIAEVETAFGPKTAIGARRTVINTAGIVEYDADAVAESLIVRESILVVVSHKGWIRALKGHSHDIGAIVFKEGDGALFTVKCETVDKLILFATDGKFYAIDASKLPGGRGHGDPLRLHAGLPEDAAPVALFRHDPERELLIASRAGNGFRVKEADVFATKKGGKQALNVGDGEAIACVPVTGSKIAVSNTKKRLLIFDVADLPRMVRGKGVRLMGGKGAELLDVATFDPAEGLAWIDGAGRRHVFEDWKDWDGKRAQAGIDRPRGFPKTGKFMPADPVAVARAMDSA